MQSMAGHAYSYGWAASESQTPPPLCTLVGHFKAKMSLQVPANDLLLY